MDRLRLAQDFVTALLRHTPVVFLSQFILSDLQYAVAQFSLNSLLGLLELALQTLWRRRRIQSWQRERRGMVLRVQTMPVAPQHESISKTFWRIVKEERVSESDDDEDGDDEHCLRPDRSRNSQRRRSRRRRYGWHGFGQLFRGWESVVAMEAFAAVTILLAGADAWEDAYFTSHGL
jgi:hypothetical protein